MDFNINITYITRISSIFFKFFHNSVRYGHIFKHAFQFRGKLTTTLSLHRNYKIIFNFDLKCYTLQNKKLP